MKAIAIILRGCSAGWLGAYGNEWIATPHLDRFAAESVVFDRHISDRPDPVAAGEAWLGRSRAPEAQLTAKLKAAGVHTILVRANHPDTDGPDWFYAAWAEVFDARPLEEDKSPLDCLIRTLPALLDRLADVPDVLLWVEIDRLLPPWDVRQDVFEAYVEEKDEESEGSREGEWREKNELDAETDEGDDDESETEDDDGDELEAEENQPGGGLSTLSHSPLSDAHTPDLAVTPCSDPPVGPFDAADADAVEWVYWSLAAVVTSLDAELGKVFDQLRARGLDQSATWVLTSDHGFPLGEHGQIGLHRPWLHEELVHLPLILRLPNGEEACRRISDFTQPPDIAPTLLDLFGLPPVAGQSLLPQCRGEAVSRRPHAVTTLELNGAAEVAIRTEDWAFLLPVTVPDGEKREPLLFEKPNDRCEVDDQRSRNVARADELEQQLRALVGVEPPD